MAEKRFGVEKIDRCSGMTTQQGPLGRSEVNPTSTDMEVGDLVNGQRPLVTQTSTIVVRVINILLWSPYRTGQTVIVLPCGFFFLLHSFFPRLISGVGDWMSAMSAIHGVALVRI